MVPSLVSLNADNEQARSYIINSAVQWLRDYGVDGFRIDHAIGQGMDFWTAFRHATRAVAPDTVSIGEVTDTPDSLKRYRGKLDGILDFPLASAFRHTFGLGDWDVQKFDRFLFAYEHFLSTGPGRVSFLDNHDMDRFLFTAGNDLERLKMAALCQFTLDACPIIYSGTEIGMTQQTAISDREAGGDAQARQDMIWDDKHWNVELLNFYRKLIHIRKETPVLRTGQRHTIHLNPERNTYAYARTNSTTGDISCGDVVALFNLSKQQQTLSLPSPLAAMEQRVLLSTSEQPQLIKTDSHLNIQLAPHSGAILALL
jgi:glycosidase